MYFTDFLELNVRHNSFTLFTVLKGLLTKSASYFHATDVITTMDHNIVIDLFDFSLKLFSFSQCNESKSLNIYNIIILFFFFQFYL